VTHHSAWAYPWDVLEDPLWADAVREAGLDALCVAASYHSVRALAPRLPGRRVVQASSGTYFAAAAPRYGEIRPVPAQWGGPVDALERCVDAAAQRGVELDAWLVVCHGSELGRRHPEHTMRNAFGDVYEYALCPSSPAVREYAAALAADVAAHGVRSLDLEAVGPLGYEHGSHHEKSRDDLTGTAKLLLSLCFCAWCERRLAERGLDVASLRAAVARAADEEIAAPGSRSLAAAVGEDAAASLLADRADATLALVAGVRAAVGAEVRLALIGSALPLGLGGVTAGGHPELAASIDALVVPLYGVDEPAAVARELAAAALASGVATDAGVRFTEPDAAGLQTRVEAAAAAGAERFRHYHFGLATRSEIQGLGRAIALTSASPAR
jgi:hypothetical protein